jgi:[acyl-carrier-protein] S-malonyltransferase
MAPAADVMAKLLADTNLSDALMPVYCNVSAAAETRADHLRANLVKQVTARVRWRETLIAMNDAGARKFIELGTGKVLSSLVKRGVDSDAIVNMEGPDDLDSVLAEM